MVKGEDSVRRKKNKVTRKKLRSKESVSARVAAIIATKKRRKAGKRRISEGMCFAVPTPDDPFRDRYRGKNGADGADDDDVLTARARSRLKKILKVEDGDDDKTSLLKVKKKKKKKTSGKLGDAQERDVDKKGLREGGRKKRVGNGELVTSNVVRKNAKISSIRPSKVLLLCLNTIQNALQNDYASDGEEERPFFATSWGIEFLKNYSSGNDMLVVGGSGPSLELIAWIVSVAADSIQNMEIEGLSTPAPFMLYIVPSQARAAEVRTVCKPLKGLGFHSVSVHPGVIIEHQIHGMKSCEPEFIVSTPERLLELVALKAINISTVSLMVVDKLEPESKVRHLEAIKSIRECLTGDPISIVYDDVQDSFGSDGRTLLREKFCTLSLDGPISTEKMHINPINNKHLKHHSKKEKSYEAQKADKESCHCCH